MIILMIPESASYFLVVSETVAMIFTSMYHCYDGWLLSYLTTLYRLKLLTSNGILVGG
jgi:hypothetical protein